MCKTFAKALEHEMLVRGTGSQRMLKWYSKNKHNAELDPTGGRGGGGF